MRYQVSIESLPMSQPPVPEGIRSLKWITLSVNGKPQKNLHLFVMEANLVTPQHLYIFDDTVSDSR